MSTVASTTNQTRTTCCCRVSAGDEPTSVSLPVWRGHILECSQSSGVVWSHGQRVCSSGTWMCLRASHRATLVRSGSCSLSAIGLAFPLWVTPHGIGPKTDPSPPHTQHTLGLGCSRS